AELKMPNEKYADAAGKYLSANAKSFEDIRIAAAGFEAIKGESAIRNQWWESLNQIQRKDPTYGKSAARDRASNLVTQLRLGGKTTDAAAIAKGLDAGQRQNGGWGKVDGEIASDLETTYRVMRCYHMLKAKPGYVEGVRSFIAKCRNPDGGY